MITSTSAATSRSHLTRSSSLLVHLLRPLVGAARTVALWFEKQGLDIDKRYRKLDGLSHLLVFVFAQLRGLRSLRDIARCSHSDPLLQLAAKVKPIGKSALSAASTELRVEFFESVLTHCSQMWKDKLPPGLPEEFGPAKAIDGSVFGCPPSMKWAKKSKESKGIRLHMSFDLQLRLPDPHQVTEAASDERAYVAEVVEAGVTYVMDRGYPSYRILETLENAGAFFAIRIPRSFPVVIVDTLPLSGNGPDQLVADQRIYLEERHGKSRGPYRLVSFRHRNGELIEVLTNRLDLTTAQIAFLYRRRWKVELLFRALKRGRLNTRNRIHWIGKSPEAVRLQIAAMILSYLLLLVATSTYHCCVEIPRALVQTIRSHLSHPRARAIEVLEVAVKSLPKELAAHSPPT